MVTGVQTCALPICEIEAAEFSTLSGDRALGLPEVLKVCMLQSHHQVAEQTELLINAERWAALSSAWQAMVEQATQAVTATLIGQQINQGATHYIEMREVQGVRFYKTPESVLRAQLQAWDRVTVRNSNGKPFVYEEDVGCFAFLYCGG